MRLSTCFVLMLLATTSVSQAMNEPKDLTEPAPRPRNKVVIAPFQTPYGKKVVSREDMSSACTIIATYNNLSTEEKETQVSLEERASVSRAYYLYVRGLSHIMKSQQEEETVFIAAEEGIKHSRFCLEHNNKQNDKFVQRIKFHLAYTLSTHLILSNEKDPETIYKSLNEIIELYNDVEEYSASLYFSNMAKTLLKAKGSLIPKADGKMEFVGKEIKRLKSKISKAEKESAGYQLVADGIEVKQLNRNQTVVPLSVKQRIEAAKKTLNSAKVVDDLKMQKQYLKEAAHHFILAANLSKVNDEKNDLNKNAMECIEDFEGEGKDAASLLTTYTGNLDFLRVFIGFYVLVGDIEKAQLRCDVLSALEKQLNCESKTTSYLRMQLKALAGDFTEFVEFLEHLRAETQAIQDEKKRVAHQRYVESAKAASNDARRHNERSKDLPPVSTAVEVRKTASVKPQPVYSPFEEQRGPENFKKDVLQNQPKEKPKSRPAAVPASSVPAPVVEVTQIEEKPLVKKVLRSDHYTTCLNLLKGGNACNSITREKIFKLFAALNCVINEKQGKGSHAVIKYIHIEKGSETLACFPELEDKSMDDTSANQPLDINNNNNINNNNVTVTVPQEKDKIKHYMLAAFKKLLMKMGYTEETIEKGKEAPKPKANPKGNKKDGKNRKK